MLKRFFVALAVAGAIATAGGAARAANILFVSDSQSDTNIPTVLRSAGHTVTVVTNDFSAGNNPTLTGSLAAYAVVYWSATGTGAGDTHTNPAVFTNLSNYVSGGGRVFVTGYDSIASPTDPNLIAFLGGSGSRDVPPDPGPAISASNSLTTGVVDLRGVTPTGGAGDRDGITGLMAGTVGVVPTSGSMTEWQWTLRTLGRGEIAYVSNGDSGASAHPSWGNTAAGGAGAYRAALLNFASSRVSRVLFVSDSQSDTNIPTVLRGDGHTVTVVTNDFSAGNNPTLAGSLAAYDVVVWSATGTGTGDTHTNPAVFTNLSSFVNGGGRVFVTGYDSIASPTDPNLIAFLGGASSRDVPPNPGAVISVANALTTGVVDIRGVTPTMFSGDRDGITGLMAGTVGVVPTSGSMTEWQWTLRTLGSGLIAYVSNGDPSPSAHAAWANTSAGGAGAYNAALRNFVGRGTGTAPTTRPNGDPCMAGTQCMSGFCVDGVCCNSACGGGATNDCQACSTAAGAATNGVCGGLNIMVASTVTCRPAAGACDAPERCAPGNTVCPTDALAAAGTMCRAAAGPCDAPEACTGGSAACPTDAFAMAGTMCRAAAGDCDAPEACTGMSAACPPDALAMAGTMCRAAAGPCDVAETCSGMSATCPTDALAAAGTECRAAAGPCDIAETCNGSVATCPADALAMDGAPCDDGMVCNGVSSCRAGACMPGMAPTCDDRDPCTMDTCAEPMGCRSTRIPGCGGPDAGPDSGPTADAGADSGPVADAGGDARADGGRDGGPVGAPRRPGCGCAVPGQSERSGAAVALAAMLGAAVMIRRRRRAA